MENLEKKIEELTNAIEKSMNNGNKEDFKKEIANLQEEIKKMGMSDDDKAKIEKAAELEEQITKMAETIDKLMKGNVDTDKQDNFVKEEKELNTYFKTGEMGETIKKTFNTTAGGALIPSPRQHEIIKEIKETSPVLRDARRYSTSAETLSIPVKNAGTSNTSTQAEGADAGAESTLAYTKLELKVGKILDWTSVTSEMINDSDFNVVNEVMQNTRENVATYLSEKVWNGTVSGEQQIEGIYKNSTVTGKALETATQGVMTWEDMNKMIYKMPPMIRSKCSFYVSTDALSVMRSWKDANDRPLYTEPLTAGEPGIFRGYKVYEDTYMDTVAGNKYPVFFGNMKDFYCWLDRKGIYMEKERDPRKDIFNFYTRMRIGGKVRQASQGLLLKIKNA